MELKQSFENVRFRHKPAFYVVGVEVDIHYNTDDGTAPIGPLWDTWNSEKIAESIPHPVTPGEVYGITHSETADNKAKYFIGMEVSTLADLPVGLVARKFSASEIAVFDTTLEVVFSGGFWRTFYAKWLPQSGYISHAEAETFGKHSGIEVYKDYVDEKSPIQIYAPVVKK